MKPIGEMNNTEILQEIEQLEEIFTEADYDALEAQLSIRAAVLGWTGDPLKQPPDSVLAAARQVIKERAKPMKGAD